MKVSLVSAFNIIFLSSKSTAGTKLTCHGTKLKIIKAMNLDKGKSDKT